MQPRLGNWVSAGPVSMLAATGQAVVRPNGRQILLWRAGEAIYACDNRCPHEGYPLAEGSLARRKVSGDGGGAGPGIDRDADKEHCVLTCHWHGWTFDLDSGETLLGGDVLRRYPVRIEDGTIQLDLTDPPPAAVRARALDGLRQAFGEHDYERLARELARFVRGRRRAVGGLGPGVRLGQGRVRIRHDPCPGRGAGLAGATGWVVRCGGGRPAGAGPRDPWASVVGRADAAGDLSVCRGNG